MDSALCATVPLSVFAIVPVTLLVYAVVGTATAAIAVVAWRQRPSPGAMSLAVLMAAAATWNVGLMVTVLAPSYPVFLVASNLVLGSAAVTVMAFLSFTLEYTGREQYLARPYVYLFGVEPVAVVAAGLTNDLHGVVWTDVATTATGYTFDTGPGLIAHLGFTYLVMTVGTALIVARVFRSRAVHRRQTLAILVGVLAPWGGNVLYFAADIATSQVAGFAVTGVVVYWALTRYRLIDLTPVARSTVMDALDVGVVVLDPDDRITDINPYAQRLFDADETAVGEDAASVVTTAPSLVDRVESGDPFETSITVSVEGTERTINVKTSSLTDALGREVGRLLLFEDVTDERRQQAQLRERNDQLQEFASMVSHDIRNPLDVASGYVELMRQTRVVDGEETRLATDRLDEAADALARIESIVDDVLTLAREGEAATDPETVSIRSTARVAWEHVVTDDATLIVGGNAKITADRGQLERLFENLFRNAVEHGASGVTVTVGIVDDDERDGFYVADDGPGIPEQLRDTVFESGVTGSDEGTGFGLAIVEELVAAHGWEVTVTDSESGGARFEVTGVDVTADPIEAG